MLIYVTVLEGRGTAEAPRSLPFARGGRAPWRSQDMCAAAGGKERLLERTARVTSAWRVGRTTKRAQVQKQLGVQEVQTLEGRRR